MRIPETAVLVSATYALDDHGVRRKTEQQKPVYGYYDSVTASEMFEGGRNGLNPSFRFRMTELDYEGQTVLIRGEERYSVYRTYRPNNGTVELYCERKGGTNGNR
jgi:hypothetical protein